MTKEPTNLRTNPEVSAAEKPDDQLGVLAPGENFLEYFNRTDASQRLRLDIDNASGSHARERPKLPERLDEPEPVLPSIAIDELPSPHTPINREIRTVDPALLTSPMAKYQDAPQRLYMPQKPGPIHRLGTAGRKRTREEFQEEPNPTRQRPSRRAESKQLPPPSQADRMRMRGDLFEAVARGDPEVWIKKLHYDYIFPRNDRLLDSRSRDAGRGIG